MDGEAPMKYENKDPNSGVFLSLDKSTVHIWQTPCTKEQNLAYFWNLLDPAEQERASRFHFEQDRRSYSTTRGTLRILLGKYLQLDPRKLTFEYSEHGKPFLPSHPHLQFNASHSGNYSLIAVTHDYSLGVDIEQHKKDIDAEGIIQRYFTPAEIKSYQTIPDADKLKAFYKGWTCKEAFLKAVGAGLANSLRDIEVDLDPHSPAAIIAINNLALQNQFWSLYQLEVPENYSAALVCNGPTQTARKFDFEKFTLL